MLLSVVATETSAVTVISIPGIGARGDLTFLQVAIGYVVGRIAVAYWLLPGYFQGEQLTAYARLEDRFGTGTRRAISSVFLVTRFLADGVRIFAGAIPLALVTGWDIPVAIVVMGVVTLVYTLFGGLKAVVWADVVQLTVYMLGGVVALGIAWQLAGGPGEALALARDAGKLTMFDFRARPHDHLHIRWWTDRWRYAVGCFPRDGSADRAALAGHGIPIACQSRALGIRDSGLLAIPAVPVGWIGHLGGRGSHLTRWRAIRYSLSSSSITSRLAWPGCWLPEF